MKRGAYFFFLILFACLFLASGVTHFVRPEPFISIVPSYLPRPDLLVSLSGAAEIILGMGLLIPCWRQFAGWGLIALLLAVFPANINMAMHPERFPQIPRVGLIARLPLQGILIGWARLYTRKRKTEEQL